MAILIQIDAITDKEVYMNLKANEMEKVTGGASITSAMINAVSKALMAIYELGKSTGSAIRRIVTKSYCPVR